MRLVGDDLRRVRHRERPHVAIGFRLGDDRCVHGREVGPRWWRHHRRAADLRMDPRDGRCCAAVEPGGNDRFADLRLERAEVVGVSGRCVEERGISFALDEKHALAFQRVALLLRGPGRSLQRVDEPPVDVVRLGGCPARVLLRVIPADREVVVRGDVVVLDRRAVDDQRDHIQVLAKRLLHSVCEADVVSTPRRCVCGGDTVCDARAGERLVKDRRVVVARVVEARRIRVVALPRAHCASLRRHVGLGDRDVGCRASEHEMVAVVAGRAADVDHVAGSDGVRDREPHLAGHRLARCGDVGRCSECAAFDRRPRQEERPLLERHRGRADRRRFDDELIAVLRRRRPRCGDGDLDRGRKRDVRRDARV